MRHTLVDKLDEIQNKKNLSEEEKDALYLKLFEEWRARNSILNDVIDGDTTFAIKFGEMQGKVGGIRLFTPNYGCYYRDELADVIGNFYPDALNSVFANPVSLGGIGAGFGILLDLVMEKKLSRREYLQKIFWYFGALSGFALGSALSANRADMLKLAEENAHYADSVIRRIYKK